MSNGVTPGQLCVLYDGDEVVGAGTIDLIATFGHCGLRIIRNQFCYRTFLMAIKFLAIPNPQS